MTGMSGWRALLLAGTIAFASSAAAAPAEIRWDTYGIPHIYGPDLLTVVRGLGYAEMENHAETLRPTAATARGRAA